MFEEASAPVQKKSIKCKQCDAEVPKLEGFQPWCECGWNLLAIVEERPASVGVDGKKKRDLLDETYIALNKQRGQAVYEKLNRLADFGASFRFSRFCFYTLCLFVWSGSLVSLIFAIATLYYFPFNILTLIFVLVLIALTYVVIPRLESPPADTVSERKCPKLWETISKVSVEIGIERPDALVVDSGFTASSRYYGLTQSKFLTLGLPLLLFLNKDERLALLARELSHFDHRDPARGALSQQCILSLMHWHKMLYPDEILARGEELSAAFGNAAMRCLARIPAALIWLMLRIRWEDSLTCQYLADRCSAQISGKAAAIGLLVKGHFGQKFDTFVQRQTLKKGEKNLFDSLTEFIANFPQREHKKASLQCELAETSLSNDTPPTCWRKKLLEDYEESEPKIVLTAEENELIDKELASLCPSIEKALINEYKIGLMKSGEPLFF